MSAPISEARWRRVLAGYLAAAVAIAAGVALDAARPPVVQHVAIVTAVC